MNGYMGKILWVDLTGGTIDEIELDEAACRNYIGGYGLGAKIIFDRQPAKVDPLGPEAIFGFMTGPFVGTPAIGGNRYIAVGKSPLTGTWGDANSGGSVAPKIRGAGYDGIFFTGKSERPVYLVIDNGKAELKDASGLWQKDTTEVEDIVRAEYGKDAEIACIGPAGEKLSLIAAIINNKGRAAARSGLGAVMGAKKLKALVVKGNMKVPLFDETKVAELRRKYLPLLGGHSVQLRNFGTSASLIKAVNSGDAPVKNFEGIGLRDFPNPDKIGHDSVVALQTKKFACYQCPIGCGGHMKAGRGEYQYAEGVHKPEYETLAMFGSNCLNDNLESIIKANDICNRYGLDSISAGACIAFAIECYENSIITKEDTDGIEMTWGNHRSIIAMLEKMARREGFGDILANGVKVAAGIIGKGVDKYAMHVQGQEYPAHDPKLHYRWAVCYHVDPTPGRHTRSGWRPLPDHNIPNFDSNSWEGQGDAQATNMNFWHVIESFGCCAMVCDCFPSVNVVIEFINAITGWDMTLEEMTRTGERIANIRHAFNLREGLSCRNFRIPDRIIGKPPATEGPHTGKTIDKEAILREYCSVMDWDIETMKPSTQKLAELGMEDITKVI